MSDLLPGCIDQNQAVPIMILDIALLLISVTMFSSTHSSRSGTAAGDVPLTHPVSHPSPGHNVQGSPHNPPSQLPPLSAVDSGTER